MFEDHWLYGVRHFIFPNTLSPFSYSDTKPFTVYVLAGMLSPQSTEMEIIHSPDCQPLGKDFPDCSI